MSTLTRIVGSIGQGPGPLYSTMPNANVLYVSPLGYEYLNLGMNLLSEPVSRNSRHFRRTLNGKILVWYLRFIAVGKVP